MNWRGWGNCSHPCGRKVLRYEPYSNMMPSTLGRICASASASSRTSIAVVGESSEISTVVMSSSSTLNGMKRGSRRAADTALLLTSVNNGRCACNVPMQPRNSPSCVRVTKHAPCSVSQDALSSAARGTPKAREISARAIGNSTFPRSVCMLVLLGKGESGITHHLVMRPRSVSGVSQTEQVRGEMVLLRRDDQAADRRAATGLLMVDWLAQLEDGLHGVAGHP